MKYADYVYEILVRECDGMDSIYEDYIVRLVGVRGLGGGGWLLKII